MIDLITATVGAPSDIIHQTCQEVLVKSPEGPIAQFYYGFAKLYRCVNNAVSSLPHFCDPVEEEQNVPCERISIAVIKAEVEEMVKMSYLTSANQASIEADVPSDHNMTHTGLEEEIYKKYSSNSGISFDFVNFTELDGIGASGTDNQFVTDEGTVTAEMEEFMELLMSCAKEVELQC